MQDAHLGVILHHFYETGRPTALLCHAPVVIVAAAMPEAGAFRAALVASDTATATGLAKDWIYAGYAMTMF